ncbi:MAG: superoxide dismutase, partial [Bartonella sp.]|nr:superoxide dismutase [Bartonella sp.]
MNKNYFIFLAPIVFLNSVSTILASSLQVKIYKLEENNTKNPIGIIEIEENTYGLIFTPSLF